MSDAVTPLDLQRMFIGAHPPLFLIEIVIRILLVYGFAAVVLRWMGKRGRRAFSPFELLVVIALGSATGDSMFYPEIPILHAWVVIAAVVTSTSAWAACSSGRAAPSASSSRRHAS